MSNRLPDPSLTLLYRLEAVLGEPLDLGEVSQGRRRIVPLTGGTFAGPELNGKLLPGTSADWQIVLADGTALCAVTWRAPRCSRGSRTSRPRRGCRCGRVHLSHLYADRDRVPRARVAEQGCLHRRRRPSRRPRGVRDVPRRVTTPGEPRKVVIV